MTWNLKNHFSLFLTSDIKQYMRNDRIWQEMKQNVSCHFYFHGHSHYFSNNIIPSPWPSTPCHPLHLKIVQKTQNSLLVGRPVRHYNNDHHHGIATLLSGCYRRHRPDWSISPNSPSPSCCVALFGDSPSPSHRSKRDRKRPVCSPAQKKNVLEQTKLLRPMRQNLLLPLHIVPHYFGITWQFLRQLYCYSAIMLL